MYRHVQDGTKVEDSVTKSEVISVSGQLNGSDAATNLYSVPSFAMNMLHGVGRHPKSPFLI